MNKQYYIKISDNNEYKIVDLEHDPYGTRLGNKINYPPPSLFSGIVYSDTLKKAFTKGISLLTTKQAIHYLKLASTPLKKEVK
jgi:hypothetical protein